MSKFVFVVLGSLHKLAQKTCVLRKFNFNLAAAASAVQVKVHESDQLLECVSVGSRAAVEDETQLGSKQLAKPLEEPSVRIYLPIILLLNRKNEVYSVRNKDFFIIQPKIVGGGLEAVKNV